MNQPLSKYEAFDNVLAMIHEMIEESIYHTQTIAHVLKTHHNQIAAKVFLDALKQFGTELEIVAKHTQNKQISVIPPWEKPYPEYTHPSLLLLDAHYQMSEEEAAEIVTAISNIHQKFYMILRNESSKKSVIDLADQLVNDLKD